MAITLAEAAVLSQDDLQRGVIETFVQESAVLDRLPLLPIEGNAYAYNKEQTLPGVQFRSVNEAYDESHGTFVQDAETLVILGGDVDVDTFIVKTRGNLNDQRALQTRAKVKAASYKFQEAFFNGDVAVDPKGFDGLKKRLTGAQVIKDHGVNLSTMDTNAAHALFDLLDDAISCVPGVNSANGAIYTNAGLMAKIKAAGRRIGGTEMVKEDLTGKRVLTYNGIAILDPGQTAAGADIIAKADTAEDADAVAGSDLYVVRFGSDESDAAVTGLTNGGISVRDLGEVDDKPAYRTRIEFFTGLATFGGRAAARVVQIGH